MCPTFRWPFVFLVRFCSLAITAAAVDNIAIARSTAPPRIRLQRGTYVMGGYSMNARVPSVVCLPPAVLPCDFGGDLVVRADETASPVHFGEGCAKVAVPYLS